MTTDRYAALRAALEAGPSDGPWEVSGPSRPSADTPEGGDFAILDGGTNIIAETFARVSEGVGGTRNAKANAMLFAAADPETIAALLKERDEFRDLLMFAGQELICGDACITDDDPKDIGEGWQESHWCPQCDDSVDRNWELRTKIRAALAAQERP